MSDPTSVDMSIGITLLAAHLDGDDVTIDTILTRVEAAQLVRELFFLSLELGRSAHNGDDQALRQTLTNALAITVEDPGDGG